MGGVCVSAGQIIHRMLLLGCNSFGCGDVAENKFRKFEMCSEAPLNSPHLCLQVFTPHRHIKHLFIPSSGFYRN